MKQIKLIIHDFEFVLYSEAANGGVLQIICSVACQEAKIRHVARKLNMFEEYLLGLSVHFNGFFQNFSCRTHQNSTRKP